MYRTFRSLFGALLVVGWICVMSGSALAQYPACVGSDGDATAAFEAGNRLLTEAVAEARLHHIERRRELAAQALAQFDRQCAAGDDSALAERGGALVLMDEHLRAAQSYDAFLARHPLESVDTRTRRGVEQMLEHSVVQVMWAGAPAELFVDGLDFGPLPRSHDLRLPGGPHAIEARDPDGHVLASTTVTAAADTPATVALAVRSEEGTAPAVTTDEPPGPAPVRVATATAPPAHHLLASGVDDTADRPAGDSILMPIAIGTAIGAGVLLITGIALHVVAENRAQTHRAAPCNGAPAPSSLPACDTVLNEYNATFPTAITFDVLAGVAAVASGVLFGIELSHGHGADPATSVRCAPSGAGVLCNGTF